MGTIDPDHVDPGGQQALEELELDVAGPSVAMIRLPHVRAQLSGNPGLREGKPAGAETPPSDPRRVAQSEAASLKSNRQAWACSRRRGWQSGFPALRARRRRLGWFPRTVASARIPEVPAVIATLVTSSPKDRTETATTAVVTAVRDASRPPWGVRAGGGARLRTLEPVVVAALVPSPAVRWPWSAWRRNREDKVGERVIAVTERRFPSRAASFEREIAVVRTRRFTAFLATPTAARPWCAADR